MKKKKVLILSVIIIIVTIICFNLPNNKLPIRKISSVDMTRVMDKSQSLFIIFYSEDCITCRKLEKDVEDAKSKKDKNLLENVYWMDVDEVNNIDIVNKYNIEGVPTAVFVKKTKIVESFSGNLNYKKLINFIEKSEEQALMGR
ncbi:hypothetical protein PMF13cell1_01469 [Blautia producta]|uniref:Thioredoxin domain-containing protein n=1 Tax=Blautia producta TaxID=33035 RepID=A0A4P6LXW0_9FIRM|nr:thioredoxin family protein [Blautia producta]QBE95943.1 hypothetical protein PMF13cell1_01469 [Blautia producta]